ncbi:hypothetical protein [Allopontixanthobacter sediminis]|uniref:Uncharacterized protein n=1 Tax=Allopontixanthobacter sediminis TaxID=1689985 RepID=A0A845B135_9SPHN|nr:hypothetical protein [Allopontixanthobacter sediminis]MXP43958.1 hypothetical protein [Allopontixanthobacter sediminis]
MIQFCLESPNEIPAFTIFMRELAKEHEMRFYDRSRETHIELQSLRDRHLELQSPASDNENVPLNDRTVNIGAARGDDFSFGAGNLGMPTDQVVIGFNGNDFKAAHAFADIAVEKLSDRWNVKEVAAGQGAFPVAHCN